MVRVVVIGLDGASFNLIMPWIKSGDLPVIKRLIMSGVYGELESCLPPVTIPNWKCYSTGMNPGKLGVFWWEIVDWENRKIRIPNARSFKGKEIWDYMSEAGLKVGIINMPGTFPPHKVNGFMISGGFSAINRNYTYPPSLEKILISRYDYRLHPKHFIQSQQDCLSTVDEIRQIIEKRFEVGSDLLEKEDLDFLHLTITYINVLHHFLWDDIEVKKTWKIIDKCIGELIRDDYDIILMSDHGSNRISRVFSINTWLEDQGYLFTKKAVADILYRIGIKREKLSRIINKLGITNAVDANSILSRIPSSLISKIPSEEGIKKKGKEEKIDWDKSKAFASGQGPIYINKTLDKQKYHDLREELIKKLESIYDSSSNSTPVKKIYLKEEIYSGDYLNNAPDVIIEQNAGWHISGNIGGNKIFYNPDKWIAENSRYGIFIANGPHISKEKKVEGIRILDLAPTILYMMKIDVPVNMDGRILKNVVSTC